ncbi:MAG TPA: hypothetical protein VGP15_08905 [Burkholderiales bacterium]|jgi:hypothetical protein|nr:hypothetical protein [Burkholderiales bacterium]
MRVSTLSFLLGCVMFFGAMSNPVFAAVSAAEYRESLREIYGKYQGVLALHEACNSAFPEARARTDKAFAAWRSRYSKLHDELDQRFAMMVKAYSNDKDYSRNYGKYQGVVLRQREEAKQALLQGSRSELEAQCNRLPEFLQSRESDLQAEFASDWLILRQWPLAAK